MRDGKKCPHCDYVCLQPSYLREHIRLHFEPSHDRKPRLYRSFEEVEVLISDGSADKKILFKDAGKNLDIKDRFEPIQDDEEFVDFYKNLDILLADEEDIDNTNSGRSDAVVPPAVAPVVTAAPTKPRPANPPMQVQEQQKQIRMRAQQALELLVQNASPRRAAEADADAADEENEEIIDDEEDEQGSSGMMDHGDGGVDDEDQEFDDEEDDQMIDCDQDQSQDQEMGSEQVMCEVDLSVADDLEEEQVEEEFVEEEGIDEDLDDSLLH